MQADFLRFLAAGGFNTILTLLIYQGLLFFISPEVSYLISYCTGLVYVYFVYPSKVFKAEKKGSGLVSVAIYLTSFFLGILIVANFSNERLAVFVAMVFTTAYGFIVTRFVLRSYF
ncbi:GtrA family protein [Enterovibrio calviensis]|uniref:GtrA family protein n=1 Tax=Enterovibrio calviensis TaxID=91359 RepID=UPI0006883E74